MHQINRTESNDYAAYYIRGLAKIGLEEYRGAIEDDLKAIAIDSEYVEAYHNNGVAKYELRDYPGAIAAFTKAIEMNTMCAKSFFCRGYLQLQLGDKYPGCIDLKQAGKLGYKEASEVLRDVEEGGEFEMLQV